MRVLDDGQRQRRRGAGRSAAESRTARSLHDAPAVVRAGAGSGRNEIHFLDYVLSDVGDVEIPGLTIECDSPGIAQAVGPHFGPSPATIRERVVEWNPVRCAAIDVDPQQLSKP